MTSKNVGANVCVLCLNDVPVRSACLSQDTYLYSHFYSFLVVAMRCRPKCFILSTFMMHAFALVIFFACRPPMSDRPPMSVSTIRCRMLVMLAVNYLMMTNSV